jgi:hypothetical protein
MWFVTVVCHMNFEYVFVLVKQPIARVLFFTVWSVVTHYESEVCHYLFLSRITV